MVRFILAAMAISFVATSTAGAADETVRGRKLAEAQCASCHSIGPGPGRSPREDAASFEDIANTPGMTALAISVWLTTPHREMPHIILDTEQRDAVIAYIVSLKR